MKNRMDKNSVMAIFTAFVCALLFLCASAARPTKAYADSSSIDEEITIRAINTGLLGGDTSGDHEYDWAVFYRGIELLAEAKWKTDDAEGTVEFAEGKIVAVYDSVNNKQLDTDGDIFDTPLDEEHTHDFISDAGSSKWESTDSGHYAVCYECGLMLEATHRPDGDGGCKDCDAALTGYDNTYSFKIPEPEELEDKWDGYTITFDIEYSADIVMGYTLNLYLQCSGELSEADADGTAIPYTIEVIPDSYGEATDPGNWGENELIWWYQTSGDDSKDDGITAEISGTITITLTIEEAIYPGTYTDTLTFSANILEYGSEES